MNGIDKAYWQKYYEFWDAFIKEWFDRRPNEPMDEVSQAYKKSVGNLNFDELPEPYFGRNYFSNENGDGGCAKAVILNLNPGMSDTICYGAYKGTNAEDTKCFRNFNQPIGWLIKKFRDEHDKKYSSFCSQWSPLNPQLRDRKNYPNYVCGLKWWQGINPDRVQGKRVPWLKRIYGNAQLSPGEVFALELCPYHSKEFSWRRNCAVCKILMPCL